MQAWSTKGYLSALGVADVASLPPSAAVLQRVVAAQVRTLLYHNAQLLAAGARPASLRTPPSLHPDALYTRLVCERAGGYCFQLNVALATCLADLGFEVRHIPATPVQSGVVDYHPPGFRSHSALVVSVPEHVGAPDAGRRFVMDAGCAYNMYAVPIEVAARDEDDATPREAHGEFDKYRIVPEHDHYHVDIWIKDAWVPTHTFARPFAFVPLSHVEELNAGVFLAPHPVRIRDHMFKAGGIVDGARVGLQGDVAPDGTWHVRMTQFWPDKRHEDVSVARVADVMRTVLRLSPPELEDMVIVLGAGAPDVCV